MMIGIFPFAFVIFVLLLTMICGGRACRTRNVPGVLVGGLLLLGIAGALFLLGSAYFVARSPLPGVAWLEEVAPMPPSPPRQVAPLQRANEVQVELPEVLGAESIDKHDASPAATASELSGPPRPAWMDAPIGRVGDIYRTRTKVGPYYTLVECERQLPDALHEAVKAYADRQLGEGKGRFVNLETSFIHDHIVGGEWEERKQDLVDSMISLNVLLEFDSAARRAIDASYRQSVVVERLAQTAGGGGVLLGLLTIVFGYLRLDTLTRGYYTGRLRLTAAAAILGLAVIAGFLVLA